ncbi:dTMP kinase [Sphingomonas sp. Leaf17]|uniref:dTMP kinase n=1 Tax=Sphingomonas sp. Leaf17 TaxID=1735683 RepID=UPI0009EB093D|nr:dTMP kinase [Sphingomonas sp. Leaf17]
MIGRFISLEGGEGAGKSTQVRALAMALEARGIVVVITREPGGSDGAEAIRALLMQGDVARWSPQAETLLFAAARADHVERTIRPALDAGRWVLTDRYVDSTRAYQGIGGVDDDAILALHRFGSGGLMPDRTFLLGLPVEQGVARATARDGAAADRFAARGEGFHLAVAQGFERIARDDRDRVRLIDASRPAAHVTADIMAGLADLLP